MKHKFFITGTDTNIGKTYITVGMLQAFNKRGLSTIGLKPIASGGDGDIQVLQNAASVFGSRDSINLFSSPEPIAPHIAAKKMKKDIDIISLYNWYKSCPKADITLIEGVGGWHTPINEKHTMADFVMLNNLDVVLVVGIRLGCINLAILTARAIQNAGLNLVGWVANCIDPNMLEINSNIATLIQYIDTHCLGVVRNRQNPASALNLDLLLQNRCVSIGEGANLSIRKF